MSYRCIPPKEDRRRGLPETDRVRIADSARRCATDLQGEIRFQFRPTRCTGAERSVSKQVVKNLSVEQRRTEYRALEFLSHQQLFFIAYAQVWTHRPLATSDFHVDKNLINKHQLRVWRITTQHALIKKIYRGIYFLSSGSYMHHNFQDYLKGNYRANHMLSFIEMA